MKEWLDEYGRTWVETKPENAAPKSAGVVNTLGGQKVGYTRTGNTVTVRHVRKLSSNLPTFNSEG